MTTVADLARAYHFAAVKHVGQQRKGKAGEPYVNHLTEVAEMVAHATAGRDIDVVIAAVLHDVLEDTAVTPEELTEKFGHRACLIVQEVTDDKSLPKAERKRLQIEHAKGLSHEAKLVKIADKTANLRALSKSPPADWTPERIAEYIVWAIAVVTHCRGASAWLEARFDEAVAGLGASV